MLTIPPQCLIFVSGVVWGLGLNYDKQYGDDKTLLPKAEPAPLPPIDKTLPLVEQAQALTQESLDAARRIMNDVTQPASAQLAAAIFIKEIGHGKATADIPRVSDKKDKSDVSSKVLALLTDAQLEELRAAGE